MAKKFFLKGLALLCIILFTFNLIGCVADTSQRTKEGATVGAVAGAVIGALIDKNNRWRGAVVGGVLGAVIGGTATYIMDKASKEAAYQKKPVEYVSEDKVQRVYAKPISSQGNCEWVTVEYYEYGKLVRQDKKLVCP